MSIWPPCPTARRLSYRLFIGRLMTAHWGSICFLCGMKFTGRCGQRGHSLRLQSKRESRKVMGFTLLSSAKHYLNRPVGVCCCLAGSSRSLFCSAHHWLAACHPDHSQEPSPHNHSSCWIIQSKQWPTFEVGNKLERRPGVDFGTESDWGRSWGRSGGGGSFDGRV